MISQPQNREVSASNNVSKVGPTPEVKIDPLPLVSAVFCWVAGKQDLTFSFAASQAPRLSFTLAVPRRTALWSYGKLMSGTYAKNKANFSPEAQEDYQPQNSSPFSLSVLSPATHIPACALYEEIGDSGKKKKATESWGHTIITFLLQCFLSLPTIITLLFLYLAS